MRLRSSCAQLTGTSTTRNPRRWCDEGDLRIEAPALDGLKLEHGVRGAARKGFESALGVGKRQVHDHAADQIEAAAKKLTVQGLAVSLAAAFEPAGANGDVGAAGNGGKQALGFFNGGGEIGVREHHDVALGLEDSRTDAVAFAGHSSGFS